MQEPLLRLDELEIYAIEQDISLVDSEVIVSAAGTDANMRFGVSNKLRERGGDSIEAELREHIPLNPGSVIETHAGTLSAQAIYHGVIVGWGDEKRVLQATVWRVVSHCIRLAQEQNRKSIAFPSLGTGAGHAEALDTHSTMAAAVLDSLSSHTSLKQIRFCFIQPEMLESFKRALLQQQLVRQTQTIKTTGQEQKEQLSSELTQIWGKYLSIEARVAELSALVNTLEKNRSPSVINQFVGGTHFTGGDFKISGDLVGGDKSTNTV